MKRRKVLFLDEPTIGLDAVAQKQIRKLLNDGDTTTLFEKYQTHKKISVAFEEETEVWTQALQKREQLIQTDQ